MHNFQISIILPCPVESSSLPDRQTLILFIDSFMPSSSLGQLDNSLLDKLALALLCLGQRGAILGPKGGGLEKPVPADNAADLVQRMRDLIHETLGPAALDKARDFLLEAVVEGESVDDGGLAARTRWRLAKEDQVSGMRWGNGIFIVPANEVTWWTPVLRIRYLSPDIVAFMWVGEMRAILVRSKYIFGLRPSQYLHPHVFVRDPGMWSLTRQTVQEVGEVVSSLEVKTLHVDNAAIRVEQLTELALFVFIGRLSGKLGDLVDDFFLGVLFVGLHDEREFYRRLIGLVDDFEGDLVVFLRFRPKCVNRHDE